MNTVIILHWESRLLRQFQGYRGVAEYRSAHCAPAFRRLKLEDLMFGLSLICTRGKNSVSRERKKAAEELCTVGLG